MAQSLAIELALSNVENTGDIRRVIPESFLLRANEVIE